MKKFLLASIFLILTISQSVFAQGNFQLDKPMSNYGNQALYIGTSFSRIFVIRNTSPSSYTGDIKIKDVFGSAIGVEKITLTSTTPGAVIWSSTGTSGALAPISSGTEYIVTVTNLPANSTITLTEQVKVISCQANGNGISKIYLSECTVGNCVLVGGTVDTNVPGEQATGLTQEIELPDAPQIVFTDLTTEPDFTCTYPGGNSNVGKRHRIIKISKTTGANLHNLTFGYGATENSNTVFSFNSFRLFKVSDTNPLDRTEETFTVTSSAIQTASCLPANDQAFQDIRMQFGDLIGDVHYEFEVDQYNCCPSNNAPQIHAMKDYLFQSNAISDCNINVYGGSYLERDYNIHVIEYTSQFLKRPVTLMGAHDDKPYEDVGNCVLKNNLDKTNNLSFVWNGYNMNIDATQLVVRITYDNGLRYTAVDNAGNNLAGSTYDHVTDPGNFNPISHLHFRNSANTSLVWNPVSIEGQLNSTPGGTYKESRTFVFRIEDCPLIGNNNKSTIPNIKQNLWDYINNSELVYALESVCENAPPMSRFKADYFWIPDTQCPSVCALFLESAERECAVMCPGCLFPGGAGLSCSFKRTTMGLKDSDNNSIADDGTTLADASTDSEIRDDMGIIGDVIKVTNGYYLTAGDQSCGSLVGPNDLKFGPLRYSYLKMSMDYGQYFSIVNGSDLKIKIVRGSTTYSIVVPFAQIPTILAIQNSTDGKAAQYYFDFSLDKLAPYMSSSLPEDRYMSKDNITFELNLQITKNEEYGDLFQEMLISNLPYFSATSDATWPGEAQLKCQGSVFENWMEYPSYNSTFNPDAKFLCEGYFGVFNLVGVYTTSINWNTQDAEQAYATNTCRKYSEYVSEITLGNKTSNLFRNEVRAVPLARQFEFPAPKGYKAIWARIYTATSRVNAVGMLEGQANIVEIPEAAIGAPVHIGDFDVYSVPINYMTISDDLGNAWFGERKDLPNNFSGDERTNYGVTYRLELICKDTDPEVQAFPPISQTSIENKIKLIVPDYPGSANGKNIVFDNTATFHEPNNILDLRNPGGTGFVISVFEKKFSKNFQLKNLPVSGGALMNPFLTLSTPNAAAFTNLTIKHNGAIIPTIIVGGQTVYVLDLTDQRTPDGNGIITEADRLQALEEYNFVIEGDLVNCNDGQTQYLLNLGYGWHCQTLQGLANLNDICSIASQNISIVPVNQDWESSLSYTQTSCSNYDFTYVLTNKAGSADNIRSVITVGSGLEINPAQIVLMYGDQSFSAGSSTFTISPAPGEYDIHVNNQLLTPSFMAKDIYGKPSVNELIFKFAVSAASGCPVETGSLVAGVKTSGLGFCGKPMQTIGVSSLKTTSTLDCPNPYVTIEGDEVFCITSPLVLTAVIHGTFIPSSYEWFIDDAGTWVTLPGQTTSTLSYMLTTNNAKLKLEVSNPQGCKLTVTKELTRGSEDYCCVYKLGDITVNCSTAVQNICVPLSAVRNVPAGIIGMDFCLKYDPTVMSYTGPLQPSSGSNLGSILGPVVTNIGNGTKNFGANYAAYNDAVNGVLRISIFYTGAGQTPTNLASFYGQGEIICLPFSVKASTNLLGTYPLIMCSANDLQEAYTLEEKPGCWKPGSLVIKQGDDARGRLVNPLYSNPITGTNIPWGYAITTVTPVGNDCDLDNQITSTRIIGSTFSVPAGSSPRIKLKRDIHDGLSYPIPLDEYIKYVNGADTWKVNRITTMDPRLVSNNTSAAIGLLWYTMIAADVNMNGHIRSNDISLIQQRITRKIPQYPQVWNQNRTSPSLDWRFVDATTIATDVSFIKSATYPNADGTGFEREKVPNIPMCLPIRKVCDGQTPELYYGVMLGDTYKGSAVPGSSLPGTNNHLRTSSDSSRVTIDAQHAQYLGNNVYRVPVVHNYKYELEDRLFAIDLYMNYDQQKIRINNVLYTSATTAGGASMMWNNVEEDEFVLTSYATLDSIPGSGISYYLDIEKYSDEPFRRENFGKLLFLLNGEEVQARVETGETVTGTTDGQSSIKPHISVIPNPASGAATIDFAVSNNSNENRIIITDVLGRTVKSFEHVQNFGMLDFNTEDLAAGMYIITLKGENGFGLSEKFQVRK